MLREVMTENGRVRGIEASDPRITAFKGIPFAKPPIGENRWRAPMPCDNWDGVLDCSRFKAISMQDRPGVGSDIYCREWHVDKDIEMSEDCLYLNVWTNAKSPDDKLPVFVWFFGGALQWGYPSEMEFDGERLARRGVIVVTVNYRLNVFGFLAHPDITKEQPESPSNFGNLDQQAGIKWVNRNIAYFGGDPDNITIAGQSAGGGSVLSQMAAKSNQGLFHKAVIMSATIRSPYDDLGVGIAAPLDIAEQNGRSFFEFMGVSTLDEARKLEAGFISQKYAEFASNNPRMYNVLDNAFCISDPLASFMNGESIDVPVLIGATNDEFINSIPAFNDAELESKAAKIFKDKADKFLSFDESHICERPGHYAPVRGVLLTAKTIISHKINKSTPKNCYLYRFDADIPGYDNPGTFHSCDLWFFFETLAKCWRPFKGHHYDLARFMCNYLANFIKTGDPNGEDADGTKMPDWEPYTNANPCEMIFCQEGAIPQANEITPFESFLMSVIRDKLRK